MPLPLSVFGSLYTDFGKLLQEVHEGVLELGIGSCGVQANDNPMRRELGFALIAMRDGVERCWEFQIPLTRCKAASDYVAKLTSVEGRAEIAAWLQQGKTPDEIRALCSSV